MKQLQERGDAVRYHGQIGRAQTHYTVDDFPLMRRVFADRLEAQKRSTSQWLHERARPIGASSAQVLRIDSACERRTEGEPFRRAHPLLLQGASSYAFRFIC